jgi:isopenicillin-N N-acyltransferase like protein
MTHKFCLCLCFILGTANLDQATEPFRFPEAKHGKGELKYVNGIPVLVLTGTPQEMGEQMGTLGVKPAVKAVAIFKAVLKQHKLDLILPLLATFGEGQLEKYPKDYRAEFEAMVKSSGVERDLLVIGNTFSDLSHLAGCSGLMIDPSQSQTGAALMGRNWDFPPVEGMHDYSLVIVFRPQGKKAFAVVGFPGAVAGCCESSAMNADGLAIGGNSISASADKAPAVEWKNTPTSIVARRLLEECGKLADVEKLLRAVRPAGRHALVACDRAGGAVFEITPKTLVMRKGTDGICVGTNHFVSKELGVPMKCWRMDLLNGALKQGKLGVKDVAAKMHEANQGAWTAHTMVFEPTALKLHVAFGDGKKSATAFPLKEIDLSKLLNP